MKLRWLVALTVIATLTTTTWCSAQSAKKGSFFDNVWQCATLYENTNNRSLQKLALAGRLQIDAARVDVDDDVLEDFTDLIWRRFRFGFKSEWFRDWVLHIEADFDLNDDLEDSYKRLTDAYVGWSPSDNLILKALKQSAGFTLDGGTSSKKLLTMQRNNLTGNLWFTSEYFTGLLGQCSLRSKWQWKVGMFSSDGSDGLSRFEAGYFTLLSLGRDFASAGALDIGLVRVDWVYNDEDPEADTPEFSQVFSLVTQWQQGSWGLWSDLSAGQGYGGQSDLWGAVLMPFYDFSPHIQTVLRYTYLSSNGPNGVSLTRYENKVAEGLGDEYDELYAGLNVFFHGHKLKWQTGLKYAHMEDKLADGGHFDGWGLSTGLRVYW
jgi:phosphate-selective porin OprO/OprP